MKLITSLFVLVLSTNAYSITGSTIIATDENNRTVVISMDATDTPRIDNDISTYPTIKNFRDNSEFAPFCYTGTIKDANKLLIALIAAADSDGDSWAELKSIRYDEQKQIEITALITSQDGEMEESYVFSACE